MRHPLMKWSLALAALFACSSTSQAQTTGNRKPGTAQVSKARTSARVPDFSGVWEPHMPESAKKYSGYSFIGEIPPMTPWGKAQYEATKPSWGPRAVLDSTDPVNPTTGTGHEVGCFPPGVPRIYVHHFPMEILQVPGHVVQIFEFGHFVREIYTNGAHEHEKDLNPSWMGDSIGWWREILWLSIQLVSTTRHGSIALGFHIPINCTWSSISGGQTTARLRLILWLTTPKHIRPLSGERKSTN